MNTRKLMLLYPVIVFSIFFYITEYNYVLSTILTLVVTYITVVILTPVENEEIMEE